MLKWADYLISAVMYDSQRQIISLKRHRDTGDKISVGEIVDRVSVASDIANGISYMTIYNALSNWKLGKKIRASRVDNTFCLRTDNNKVKHDNLGSLLELTSDVLVDESSKKITKKISNNKIKPQISSQDKIMLQNMGVRSSNIKY